MKLICLLGWRCMLNFCPWSQEPHASCWLRYELAIYVIQWNVFICLFVFKYLMYFTFLDILGCGHCIWGPPGDLGDADSGLAVASWPFYHPTLHLCRPVFCEYDFIGRGMFHITRSSFVMGHGCRVRVQWLPESARYDVLTGNQEKALATLKRIATENGAPMPLGKLTAARQVRDIYTVMLSNMYMPVWYIYVIIPLIRRIVGRFGTCFHLTSAGLQSCCGLFGMWHHMS